ARRAGPCDLHMEAAEGPSYCARRRAAGEGADQRLALAARLAGRYITLEPRKYCALLQNSYANLQPLSVRRRYTPQRRRSGALRNFDHSRSFLLAQRITFSACEGMIYSNRARSEICGGGDFLFWQRRSLLPWDF